MTRQKNPLPERNGCLFLLDTTPVIRGKTYYYNVLCMRTKFETLISMSHYVEKDRTHCVMCYKKDRRDLPLAYDPQPNQMKLWDENKTPT
jgi:hypothetical protein